MFVGKVVAGPTSPCSCTWLRFEVSIFCGNHQLLRSFSFFNLQPIISDCFYRCYNTIKDASAIHRYYHISSPLLLLGLCECIRRPDISFHGGYQQICTNVITSCNVNFIRCHSTQLYRSINSHNHSHLSNHLSSTASSGQRSTNRNHTPNRPRSLRCHPQRINLFQRSRRHSLQFD